MENASSSEAIDFTANTLIMDFTTLENSALGYHDFGAHLKDHIYERSRLMFARGEAERDALKSEEDIRLRQKHLRNSIVESLGGLPSCNTPLNARTTGVIKSEEFSIEKIIFESSPRRYVTTNLYLPNQTLQTGAAVLFLCGHAAAGKEYAAYQVVCQILVQAGLIVLAQDPIGQGERLSYYDPTQQKPLVPPSTWDHDYAGAQCRLIGDSIARYFLHDAMRSLDYLSSRTEVDASRIGVTGSSGGGMQTGLLMMADSRVAAAAPATFIMSRESYLYTGQPQDAEQIWPGFTSRGYDHEDILLAMAPKPVCVLAVKSDFFPIEGTRRTVARSRRFWEIMGQGQKLELVEDESTHAYTPILGQAAARFFSRHLSGKEEKRSDWRVEPFSPATLWCTTSGQVRSEFADAEFIFDANIERIKESDRIQKKLSPSDRRKKTLQWLREKIFFHREACELNPRFTGQEIFEGVEAKIGFWWSQRNIANMGIVFRLMEHQGKTLPVTISILDEGTCGLDRHWKWIRNECLRGKAVMVLNLCGMGPLRPHPVNRREDHNFYGTFHKLSDDLTWLGDSLTAMRVYEIVRSVELISEWTGLKASDIEIFAIGRYGLYARLAAAIESRISNCKWLDAYTYRDLAENRYYDSYDIKALLLPGLLKYADLDEL